MTQTEYDNTINNVSSLTSGGRSPFTLFFRGYKDYEGFIEFQFVPRVPTDNRLFKWEESDAYGFEPILSFKGNGPRTITLKWQYIVESEEYDPYSDKWTIGRIKRMINMLRGYHSLAREANGSTPLGMDGLVCVLQLGGIAGPNNVGGTRTWTAAMRNVSVTHSDTYIGPPTYAFPLSTNISADFSLWTSDSIIKGIAGGGSIVAVNHLNTAPLFDDYWY